MTRPTLALLAPAVLSLAALASCGAAGAPVAPDGTVPKPAAGVSVSGYATAGMTFGDQSTPVH